MRKNRLLESHYLLMEGSDLVMVQYKVALQNSVYCTRIKHNLK